MTLMLVCDDFVGDTLADVAKAPEAPLARVVTLSELFALNGIGFDPERGDLARTGAARPPEGARILDRVAEISPETLKRLDGDTGMLRAGQVFAWYDALVRDAAPASADCQYTRLGKLLPLPTQWYLVAAAGLGLAVPDFVYGYGPAEVDASALDSPIFKSPFDLYNWRANQRPEGLIWDELVVARPTGSPVICYFLGSSTFSVRSLGPAAEPISEATLAELKRITPELRKLFAAEVGECLFFVDGEQITFCAFSHFLFGADRVDGFAAEATAWLRGLTG